jgi:hypothetical protein
VQKVAQICEISDNFGCFLPGNKDWNPCLEDPDFLSLIKKGQRVGSLNPNPWIHSNTTRRAAGTVKSSGARLFLQISLENRRISLYFSLEILEPQNFPSNSVKFS